MTLLIVFGPALDVAALGIMGPLILHKWRGWLVAALALPPTALNLVIAIDGVYGASANGQWLLDIMIDGWLSLPIVGVVFAVL